MRAKFFEGASGAYLKIHFLPLDLVDNLDGYRFFFTSLIEVKIDKIKLHRNMGVHS